MPRRILVTGASSGIGLAITEKLLATGNEVWGIARRLQEKKHSRFYPYSIDLSKLDSLSDKLKPFTKVDTVICNVGKGHFGNLEELSFKQIRSLIDLNFLSHVYLIKKLLPYLKMQQRADIIFIGSEASLIGKKKGSVYCASKFALRGFAQSLRDECSCSSVKVSIVQPGMVRTPFYDTLEFNPGEDESHAILPEDIAEMTYLILKMRTGTVCDEVILSPMKKLVQKKTENLNSSSAAKMENGEKII